MSKLIEYLENIDILSQEQLFDYVDNNDIATLNSLVLYIRKLINEDYKHSTYTPFVFVPNGDISGTGGCDEITCSMSRAEKFAVFSALYADKVYIQLQFITNEHYELIDIDEVEQDERLYGNYIMRVLKDLSIILVYSELIKNDIVIITPSHRMLCQDCFQKEVLGNNVLDLSALKKDYINKSKVYLRDFDNENNEAEISINNIDEFFPDHELFWCVTDPDEIAVLKKEHVGKPIKNKQFCQQFIESFIEDEIASALYTTKYCNDQNAKLITNKLSDAMFLSMDKRNKNDIENIKRQTQILPEYDLLMLQNISIKDVIRLRQEENEAFNKYRIALNNAVKEQHSTSNVTDWYKIYDDIVYPEINNLNLKIKQIKNGRLNRFFGTMVVVTTALVANRFGNMINPDLFANITNITSFATTVGAAGVNVILDKSSTKKADLQNNDFFFLWKLQKKNKNKS